MKQAWITEGFDAFRRGTFGNGGQNIYVSKKGILQRIFQYDLDRNGYVDLVYANCQNHSESAPSYVYTMDGTRTELPGQGSVCGMMLDIDGDGYQDLVVAGNSDAAAPFASTDIYFGGPDGYSENRRTRIPTPHAMDCCYGDVSGKGKPALIFSLPCYQTVRIFEQTELYYEWTRYVDLPIDADLVACTDLNGDGYDDLITRKRNKTETTVYWGSADGIQTDRCTVLPELPAEDALWESRFAAPKRIMERKYQVSSLLQTVAWNGRNCFTLSTGKKLEFWSADGQQLECVLSLDIPFAMAAAVGDLDGDGYEDITVAALDCPCADSEQQYSYVIWNGPEGLDVRPRTAIATTQAVDVSILDRKLLIAQSAFYRDYTHDALLFTWPDLQNPQMFQGEDTRRCELFRNADGVDRIFLLNHYSRSLIGYQSAYVYWGDKDGFSPDRRLDVPCHCAVDALIADLDDDGWAELLIGNNAEESLELDVGHQLHFFGPNGFEPDRSLTLKTEGGWGIMAGDFNHDGYLEIVSGAKKMGRSSDVLRQGQLPDL